MASLLAASVVGCTRAEPPNEHSLPVVTKPAQARREVLTSASFDTMIRVASPIRPPSSDDGRVRIVTYVEIPRGAALDVDDDTLMSMRLPIGAYAARVEYLAPVGTPIDALPSRDWRILDVRSTRFGATNERYAVARELPSGGHAWVEWPKPEHVDGTAALVRFARAGGLGGSTAADHERIADKLASINDCPSCHGPRSPANDAPDALVRRGTDASGLYTIAALFRDEGPFETYRPRDLNEGDPRVVARCGARGVASSRVRCADGSRPRGHHDVDAGIVAGDLHSLEVCVSRRALASRMTDRARASVASALLACPK